MPRSRGGGVIDGHPFVEQFETQRDLYNSFRVRLEGLLLELINDAGLREHSLSSRVKELDSFQKKISRKNNKYESLGDITDIVGLRVITYYEQDVSLIGDIIEREFVLDSGNSVDKRALLEPDKFGYVSRHYVVSLSDDRLKLSENKKFSGLKAEVQVRSILQHAWAEMEHDMGYKSEQSIPKHYRRSFARLAGLLELADEEFNRIRSGLRDYEEEVERDMPIVPSKIGLDKVSLRSYVGSSPIVARIDTAIVDWVGGKLSGIFSEDVIERRLECLLYFGVKTIADLDSLMATYENMIISFARSWLEKNGENFGPGISIFYLMYILASRDNNADEVFDYLEFANIGSADDESLSEIARRVLSTKMDIDR